MNKEDINNSIESEYEENYILKLKDLADIYYPIYPNSINGYTTYFKIHRYLISRKLNSKKNLYPDYIKDLIDSEAETEKRKFRYICLNYCLNDFNELCYLKLKKRKKRYNKGKIYNYHKKKKKGDYIILKIPFKNDYISKLKEIHNINHRSYKKLSKV